MANPTHSEMMDIIFDQLYNGGNYKSANVNEILKQNNWTFETKRDHEKWVNSYLFDGWVTLWGDGTTHLTSKGIINIEKWGTYSKYDEFTKKTNRDEYLKKENDIKREKRKRRG